METKNEVALKDDLNPGNWQAMKERATMLVKSGFLPQAIKTPEQAIAIAMTGKELGIGMMEAFRSINVILGKPTVSPQLMLALANRTGDLEDININSTNEFCEIIIKRKGRSPHMEKFGVQEAKAMGLMGKDNYTKQPATMFKWRALAANLRITFPDVILGLYTPEELGAEVTVNETEEMSIVAPVANVVQTEPAAWAHPAELPPALEMEKGIETVVVGIQEVKKFKNKANDNFNFVIIDSEGASYRTFSETDATVAKEALEQGWVCRITFKKSKFGNQVVGLNSEVK